LSEVPSLLSVGVALRALVFSLEHRSTQRIVGIAFSGLSLMLAALMRLDMTLCFFGFLVAALLLPQKAFRRAELIRVAPVVLFVGCLGYLACAGILGIPIASFRPYFDSFVQLETKSNAMSVLGVLSFGGAGYLLAGLGLLCVTRAAGFLLVWLGLTVIPMIVITANYMVEPRYLSCAVIPLAGLVTIGLSRIDRLRGRAQRLVLPAVVVVAVVSSALFIPLMPYEVDRPALTRAVGEVLDRDPNAAILVPWAYTDFHFLRLTLPDRPVYNVNTPGGSLAAISGPWRARLDDWYGINYLDDPDRLSELLTHQHAYYVGWRWYPPMENALHFAERFGLDAVANRLRRLGLMDHRTQSWLWNDPRFDLEPAGRAGQYEVFRVSPASVSVTTAGAGNALARSNESSPELPGRPHRLAPVDRAGLR
jgi:hypothetical protein